MYSWRCSSVLSRFRRQYGSRYLPEGCSIPHPTVSNTHARPNRHLVPQEEPSIASFCSSIPRNPTVSNQNLPLRVKFEYGVESWTALHRRKTSIFCKICFSTLPGIFRSPFMAHFCIDGFQYPRDTCIFFFGEIQTLRHKEKSDAGISARNDGPHPFVLAFFLSC